MTSLSKYISKILRHEAIKIGLEIDSNGWVSIDSILVHLKTITCFRHTTLEDIIQIVEDEKQKKVRFTIIDGYIRANQGHTIPNINPDLTEITDPNEFPICIHGTYDTCIVEIEAAGLSKMTRNHIHMNTKIPEKEEVISGMRKSCNRIVWINMPKAMELGIKFFVSTNGVILSPGNDDGYIPPSCFNEITVR